MRIQEEKSELQKKVHRRICVGEINFLAPRPPSYVIFYRFFRLLPPFHLLRSYAEKKFLFQKMARGLAPPCPPVPTALLLLVKYKK